MKPLLFHRKLIIVSLLFFLIPLSAVANEPQLKTFHNVSVLPHTGQMQYDVELYRIQDADFDWPISITYSSDGFRPFDYSDPVGSGWTLNAGGVITRQIMGDADDNIKTGFEVWIQDTTQSKCSIKDIYNESYRCYNSLYDYQSDIYSFSFNGYNGQFILGYDGKPLFLSGDIVDVDFSGMTPQQTSNIIFDPGIYQPRPNVSTIKLTTTDGYQYVFGGVHNALEYSYYVGIPLQPIPNIIAWHLTKVIAPNKHELNFYYREQAAVDDLALYHYEEGNELEFYNNYAKTYSLPLEVNVLDYKLLKHDTCHYTRNLFATLSKHALIDSIKTSNNILKIYFDYNYHPNNVFYPIQAHGSMCNPESPYQTDSLARKVQLMLQKIRIQTAEEQQQWILQQQKITIESTNRLYLTSLSHESGPRYSFQYDFSDINHLTKINSFDSIDIYGYRISAPLFGLLQSATDPFGAVTNFTYNLCRHDSIRIFERSTLGYTSRVYACYAKKMIHSAIVSEIEVTDTDGLFILSKRYEYGTFPHNINDNQQKTIDSNNWINSINRIGESSGILNIDYALCNDTSIGNTRYLLCPYQLLHANDLTHLEYSMVREYIHKEPNKIAITNIYRYNSTSDRLIAKGNDLKSIINFYPYVSQYNRRSKLACKEEYDEQNHLHKKNTYSYYPLIVQASNTSSSVLSPYAAPWSVAATNSATCKIFYSPYWLMSHKCYEYNSSYTLINSISYQRDALQRIVREDTEDGNRRRFVRYTYPDNLQLGSDTLSDKQVAGYAGLVRQHRIGSPVETVSGFVRNGKEYITHGEITLYKKYGVGGTIVPPYNPPDLSDSVAYGMEDATVRNAPVIVAPAWYAPAATLSLQTSEPLTDYAPLSVQDNKICADSRYDTTAVYSYNRQLRMTKVIPQNSVPVHYQWDEQGLYCIAETSGGQQHSYTYYPYIGIASDTDPRGVTTYYAYDSLGRLTEVWRIVDGKKQIINAWNYHYATEE